MLTTSKFPIEGKDTKVQFNDRETGPQKLHRVVFNYRLGDLLGKVTGIDKFCVEDIHEDIEGKTKEEVHNRAITECTSTGTFDTLTNYLDFVANLTINVTPAEHASLMRDLPRN